MTLQEIEIPDSIKQLPNSTHASRLIDTANERIETFMLADQKVIENFVTCDFHLFDQALSWIEQNHLLTGNRFCEFGSGFGVATMLAAIRGMKAMGIEIETVLVEQSASLAAELEVDANFYAGSFVPRDTPELAQLETEVKNVTTDVGDVYEEVGLDVDDFDLFFAFPWPGENGFFEAIVEAKAAVGAMLLTYRGREGMHLLRKTS